MKEIWDTQTNEELIKEYQITKNKDLFEYFLSRNYGLILKYILPIINKYPEQKDELEQQCRIAMWLAILKFNTAKNFKFSTYVQYWFKHRINLHYAEQPTVHIPINLLSNLKQVREKVPYAIIKGESINNTVSNSENDLLLEDVLASNDESPIDLVINKDKEQRLLNLLEKLNPRENRCIQLYFGLNGYTPHTLQMIGEQYNVTRERIRQVISKALLKIKKICENKGYGEDDF